MNTVPKRERRFAFGTFMLTLCLCENPIEVIDKFSIKLFYCRDYFFSPVTDRDEVVDRNAVKSAVNK
jgi:hypothetical protein